MGLEVLALKFKHLMYTSDALQCHRPTWQDLVGKLCVLKYLLEQHPQQQVQQQVDSSRCGCPLLVPSTRKES